jgi:hypothetical protein
MAVLSRLRSRCRQVRSALAAWLHLNRFRLYEAESAPVIDSLRTQNEHLEDLGQPEYGSQYRFPVPNAPQAGRTGHPVTALRSASHTS